MDRANLTSLNRELGLVSAETLYQSAARELRRTNTPFVARVLRQLAQEVMKSSETRALFHKVQARGALRG